MAIIPTQQGGQRAYFQTDSRPANCVGVVLWRPAANWLMAGPRAAIGRAIVPLREGRTPPCCGPAARTSCGQGAAKIRQNHKTAPFQSNRGVAGRIDAGAAASRRRFPAVQCPSRCGQGIENQPSARIHLRKRNGASCWRRSAPRGPVRDWSSTAAAARVPAQPSRTGCGHQTDRGTAQAGLCGVEAARQVTIWGDGGGEKAG